IAAPNRQPRAVPTRRSNETLSTARSDDCTITKVVIGAQYASGRRNNPPTATETTAVTAVRAECTKTGRHCLAASALAIFTRRRDYAYRSLFGLDPFKP